jgi:hypothetical protein
MWPTSGTTFSSSHQPLRLVSCKRRTATATYGIRNHERADGREERIASKRRVIQEAREAEHDRPKEHEPPVFGAAGAAAERAPAREGAPNGLRHGHGQRSFLA